MPGPETFHPEEEEPMPNLFVSPRRSSDDTRQTNPPLSSPTEERPLRPEERYDILDGATSPRDIQLMRGERIFDSIKAKFDPAVIDSYPLTAENVDTLILLCHPDLGFSHADEGHAAIDALTFKDSQFAEWTIRYFYYEGALLYTERRTKKDNYTSVIVHFEREDGTQESITFLESGDTCTKERHEVVRHTRYTTYTYNIYYNLDGTTDETYEQATRLNDDMLLDSGVPEFRNPTGITRFYLRRDPDGFPVRYSDRG